MNIFNTFLVFYGLNLIKYNEIDIIEFLFIKCANPAISSDQLETKIDTPFSDENLIEKIHNQVIDKKNERENEKIKENMQNENIDIKNEQEISLGSLNEETNRSPITNENVIVSQPINYVDPNPFIISQQPVVNSNGDETTETVVAGLESINNDHNEICCNCGVSDCCHGENNCDVGCGEIYQNFFTGCYEGFTSAFRCCVDGLLKPVSGCNEGCQCDNCQTCDCCSLELCACVCDANFVEAMCEICLNVGECCCTSLCLICEGLAQCPG